MERKNKAKQIGIFVGSCLLLLAFAIGVCLLLRNYTLSRIDISQAEEIFLVAHDELIPIEQEDAAKLIAIFTDAEAHPNNVALSACPFERGFLFKLPDQRGALLSYSSDDCGTIRMQPMEMGSLTYWFTANNPLEGAEYLRALYQKYE